MEGGVLTREDLDRAREHLNTQTSMPEPFYPGFLLSNEELLWFLQHTKMRFIVHPSQRKYIEDRLNES